VPEQVVPCYLLSNLSAKKIHIAPQFVPVCMGGVCLLRVHPYTAFNHGLEIPFRCWHSGVWNCWRIHGFLASESERRGVKSSCARRLNIFYCLLLFEPLSWLVHYLTIRVHCGSLGLNTGRQCNYEQSAACLCLFFSIYVYTQTPWAASPLLSSPSLSFT